MFGNSIVPDYHEWIVQNLSHDNLTVEVLRLEAARRLLGESERSIEQIARGDEERIRFSFQRNLGGHRRSIGSGFRGNEGSLGSFFRSGMAISQHCACVAHAPSN
ncbi:hypothetical protein EMIT0P44_520016 [Pseudomonas sp. IT-P44]